jgi:hypothetical protein
VIASGDTPLLLEDQDQGSTIVADIISQQQIEKVSIANQRMSGYTITQKYQ